MYIACVVVVVLLKRKSEEHRALKNILAAITCESPAQFPKGGRVYWSKYTGNKCLRCTNGKIARRHRFKIIGGAEGKVTLHELRGVYWCDSCNYHGLSMITPKGE